jgi:hypothetical protein
MAILGKNVKFCNGLTLTHKKSKNMKKTFNIRTKGTLTNLLQSVAIQTGHTANMVGDPAKSCYDMVATKRPEISLA